MAPAALSTPQHVAISATKSQPASIPAWVKPDLAALLHVEHRSGDFAACSVSLVSLPAGAIFARITTPTIATKAYTSVQAGPDLHIELNSDLVYINHSCEPTLIFDMARWEVRVNPALSGGLQPGMELTFFYPSTEWHMAQPFKCLCGTAQCLGTVSGARDLGGKLAGYYLNAHIEDLLVEQAAQGEKK
ncbi:uncharacterized protein BDZ99DRAFT_467323 [Mytilinidion resinicola]|uniref:Post-SET domain-containing protein n=1 Tax=Mytilinidion resinicola TaxID=574789 RepID=A0A6A6Y7W0_9PEZI|nr:uncharacterized protein BDZ99DRAFT_467323 [Mytilinidion resinicola]KAF2804638.1 hypothetical protein BDZ99DRAFT_467323 [Mytilinidion resinicola]